MARTAKSKHKSRGSTAGSKTEHATKRSTGRSKTSTKASTKTSKTQSTLGSTAVKVLAGAASAVRAFVPQLDATTVSDGATSFLEKQHRQVERSFAAALNTADTRERRAAMNDVIEQLTLHTQLEETIFYPAVRGIDTEQAKDMVLEAYEEHHVVKMILKELPKVDPKADNFEAKMTVLKELVEHHVEEEEREMFPLAERKLGPERSRELRDQMAAEAPAQ